jgi:hypothetical protein
LEQVKQARNATERLLLDRDTLLEEIKQLQEAADAAAADHGFCQVKIAKLEDAEAKLKLEIEISRASLARAIAENERLRVQFADDHSPRDRSADQSH